MSNQRPNGWVQIIAAVASCVTAIGTAIVIVISAWNSAHLKDTKEVLVQVEKQGNSVALEQKRVTSEALRAIATVTKKPADELKAKDAETLYEEAKKQAELNALKNPKK